LPAIALATAGLFAAIPLSLRSFAACRAVGLAEAGLFVFSECYNIAGGSTSPQGSMHGRAIR